MGKKKIIIAISIIICLAVCVYIFVFSKPRVKCTKVRVISLMNTSSTSRDDHVEDVIVDLMEDAKQGDSYQSLQLFFDNELSSYDEADYAVIRFDIEVKNSTVYDAYCKYLLVDEYDTDSGVLVVTIPQLGTNQFKRMSTTDVPNSLAIYICIKDKSKEELEDIIHNMVLQVPYSNKINKTGSVKISLKDVPVEFELD